MIGNDINSRSLYRIGGVFALVQLAANLSSIVIAVALGPRPTSAAEFFAISGMLGNALDLVQHLLHPFALSIAAPYPDVHGHFLHCLVPDAGTRLLPDGAKRRKGK